VKVEKSQAATPSPAAENDNLTSDGKRASEKRPPLATINVGAVLNDSDDASVRTLNDDPERVPKMEYSAHHYEAIKEGVIDGSINPTMRPVKNALVSLNIKFVDDATRQKKATAILDQLLEEGVLMDNPEFGLTGKVVAKFILNPDYRSGKVAKSVNAESGSKQGARDQSFKYFNYGRAIKAGHEPAPEWINNPDTKIEVNEGVPLFTLEAEEIFRLAILTPDKKFMLYDLGAKNIDEAIRILDGEGHEDYNQAHEDYQTMIKNSKSGAKVSPVAGAGIGISEDGINPMVGLGAIITKGLGK